MELQKASIDDLILQLRTYSHKSGHPDYMLWIGAGASVTSGIPSAADIVSELLRRVYAQRGRKNMEATQEVPDQSIREWAIPTLAWFDPSHSSKSEYAQAMENVYPSPGKREDFLRELVAKARPSIGYKYLGLLLRKGIFDTLLTTNFDQMVRIGVSPFLAQPIVEVNALEQYHLLQPFPEYPRLIRMHGDFWHNNLLNTEGELEKTPEVRHKAVKRLLHSYGLVVVGYAGQDMTIMQGIFDPLKNDSAAFRKGLYWCHRKGDSLSPLVETLMRFTTDNRAFLVEIEDFDSMMKQVAAAFGLDIPSASDYEIQLRFDWEGQSLLFDLIRYVFAGSKLESTRKCLGALLGRLVDLLGQPQAILFCCKGDSTSWQAEATANISMDPKYVRIAADLLAQVVHEPCEYVVYSAHDRLTADPFAAVFSTNCMIEVFPVWKDVDLLGFVAFASTQSVIEHATPLFIKAAVTLLIAGGVNISSER